MPIWIDMRQDLHALIYGDARTVPQGYWFVLRVMRIGQYSAYWDPDRKEAVGGPKWLYDDYTMRGIEKPGEALGRMPNIREGTFNLIQELGTEVHNAVVIAMEWNGTPRLPIEGEDLVYRIAQSGSVARPRPPLTVRDRMQIRNCIPVEGDYGRIEIIYLICLKVHGES